MLGQGVRRCVFGQDHRNPLIIERKNPAEAGLNFLD
jgi:hypothetical protein